MLTLETNSRVTPHNKRRNRWCKVEVAMKSVVPAPNISPLATFMLIGQRRNTPRSKVSMPAMKTLRDGRAES
jgi:hypothetical protein